MSKETYIYPTYKNMVVRTETNAPYRGTPNRFPLLNRRSTRHYFLKQEIEGKTVFDICYGNRFDQVEITKEEYNELTAKGFNAYQHSNGSCFRYDKKYNPIVRVHPDDTMEFIAESLFQGDRMFLCSYIMNANVVNDSRRGGVIIKSHDGMVMLPIYKGMRVDRSLKPVNDVTITTYKVDRKKSRELVKSYEHFFKVSEVMFSAMTDHVVFSKTVKDIANDHLGDLTFNPTGEWFRFDDEKVRDKGVALINTAPLDAAVLIGLYQGAPQMQHMAREGVIPSWARERFNPDALYATIKRNMLKTIYRAMPEIFKEHTVPVGSVFPPTMWGVDIKENGELVEQYGYSVA